MGNAWSPDPTFWRHRRVAVTGATGFLGSHVVDLLERLDAEVVVLVRDSVPLTPIARRWIDKVSAVTGSVEDGATVERLLGEYQSQTVFHLAAQTQVGIANKGPTSTFEANIGGTWAVLEASRRAPTVEQVLVASSDKAYGRQEHLPYTEEMPLRALHPYDVSKACADLISQSYAATYGVTLAITRCGNFFGPGDMNWDRIVPGTIRDFIEGRRPRIRSDGSPTRDYLYVVDAALAYLRLAEALATDLSLAGETFNFSVERPMSVLELTGLIRVLIGSDLEPEILAIATNEIDHQYLSAGKARQVLGWEPAFTLETALSETVQWYRSLLGG